MARFLLTGGAGHIGSQVACQAACAGHTVLVYDNLSTGTRLVERWAELVVGDVRDRARVEDTVRRFAPDLTMHFAAKIVVPESVREPLLYYDNNVGGTISLLQALASCGTDRFIFSSTAAVYGIPQAIPVAEEAPLAPINPYGRSKMAVEHLLADLAASGQLRPASLRYFNVAGADPAGRLGDTKEDATHLVTSCVRVACGLRPFLEVFGTDYPTPDGTCIRDYIHVADLAAAHLAVADYLLQGGSPRVFNCGYGHGFSVWEVVQAARRVTGVDFPTRIAPRRPGDPPALVADATRLRQELGWQPAYDDLDTIVRHAWEWEKVRPVGRS